MLIFHRLKGASIAALVNRWQTFGPLVRFIVLRSLAKTRSEVVVAFVVIVMDLGLRVSNLLFRVLLVAVILCWRHAEASIREVTLILETLVVPIARVIESIGSVPRHLLNCTLNW